MNYRKKYLKYKKKYLNFKNGVPNQKDNLFLSTHKLNTIKNKYKGGAEADRIHPNIQGFDYDHDKSERSLYLANVIYISHAFSDEEKFANNNARKDFSTLFNPFVTSKMLETSEMIRESLTGVVLRDNPRIPFEIFAACNEGKHDYRDRTNLNLTPFEKCIDILETKMVTQLQVGFPNFEFSGISWHTSQFQTINNMMPLIGTGQDFHRDTQLPNLNVDLDQPIWKIFNPITRRMRDTFYEVEGHMNAVFNVNDNTYEQVFAGLTPYLNRYISAPNVFNPPQELWTYVLSVGVWPNLENIGPLIIWIASCGFWNHLATNNFEHTLNGNFWNGGNPLKLLYFIYRSVPLINTYIQTLNNPAYEPQSIVCLHYLNVSPDYDGAQWEATFLGEGETAETQALIDYPVNPGLTQHIQTGRTDGGINITPNTVFNDRIFIQPQEGDIIAFADTHIIHRRANALIRKNPNPGSPYSDRSFFASVLVGHQRRDTKRDVVNNYINTPNLNHIWKKIVRYYGSMPNPMPYITIRRDVFIEDNDTLSGKHNQIYIQQRGGRSLTDTYSSIMKGKSTYPYLDYPKTIMQNKPTNSINKKISKISETNNTEEINFFKEKEELQNQYYNLEIQIRDATYKNILNKDKNLDTVFPTSSQEIKKMIESYLNKQEDHDIKLLINKQNEIKKQLETLGGDIYEIFPY